MTGIRILHVQFLRPFPFDTATRGNSALLRWTEVSRYMSCEIVN